MQIKYGRCVGNLADESMCSRLPNRREDYGCCEWVENLEMPDRARQVDVCPTLGASGVSGDYGRTTMGVIQESRVV
jgi:hypothetical protein